MDAQNISLTIAFLAGLLSFASPCVLPLVPAYMGYLGGTTVYSGEQAGTRQETARTFLHSLFFVLGFSLVFVLLGATATFLGRLMYDYLVVLQRVGGVMLVIFGMRLMGIGWSKRRWIVAALVVAAVTFVLESGLLSLRTIDIGPYTLNWVADSAMMAFVVLAGADGSTVRQVILATGAGLLNFVGSYDTPIPNLIASVLIAAVTFFLNRADFFYAEKKLEIKHTGEVSYLRSLLFGVVFAAGWTPCIGPILTAILLVAGQLETVGQGVLLLAVYSLGLAIPFLLMGLAFGSLSGWLRKMNRYLGIVSIISGVLLVLMGILIFTNSLGFLSQFGSFIDFEF